MAPMTSSTIPKRPSLIFARTLEQKRFVLEKRARHRRLDEGRRDRVDADSERAKLDGHRLGQAFEAMLARTVKRAVRRADMAHL